MGAPSGRPDRNKLLRRLPAVDELLRLSVGQELLSQAPKWAVLQAARQEIDRLRGVLLGHEGSQPPPEPVPDAAEMRKQVAGLLARSLEPVVNATGVVLHTNLGRAPLHPEAAARAHEIACAYSNLEYEIDERRRGSRHDHVARLLCDLTGAEAACVVNNNAGAVLLGLAALAGGKEVVVSRGELVEIGGSFRIPDVMRASGAILREVGTTNKTHLTDYLSAIAPQTGLLLKVHRSNFALVGFTAEVEAAELASAARSRSLFSMFDLGSGALVPIAGEPTVQAAVAAGVDLITFSGDKLLGGPQAGLLVGRAEPIALLRKHPLMRALRPDKMTIAALEATLELYRDGRQAEIPALAMLQAPLADLSARASRLRAALEKAAPSWTFELKEVRSAVGGGALPTHEPESWAVVAGRPGHSPEALDAQLRAARPPVIGRIADGMLLLDVRTMCDDDIPIVARAVAGPGAQS